MHEYHQRHGPTAHLLACRQLRTLCTTSLPSPSPVPNTLQDELSKSTAGVPAASLLPKPTNLEGSIEQFSSLVVPPVVSKRGEELASSARLVVDGRPSVFQHTPKVPHKFGNAKVSLGRSHIILVWHTGGAGQLSSTAGGAHPRGLGLTGMARGGQGAMLLCGASTGTCLSFLRMTVALFGIESEAWH